MTLKASWLYKVRQVKIQVPATITNLGPGINTFGLAIKIYNYITIEETETPGYTVTNLNYASILPVTDENPILAVMKDFFSKINYKPKCGLHLTNDFNIPLRKGLESISAGIVGVLVASSIIANCELTDNIINVLTHYRPTPQNICASIYGGFAISTLLENPSQPLISYKVPFPHDLKLTVIIPDHEISTETLKQVSPTKITLNDSIFNLSRASLLIAAICTGNYKGLNFMLEDRLIYPYIRRLIPGSDEIALIAKTSENVGITTCGSGSSILLVYKNSCNSIIERIKKIYSRHRIATQVIHTEVDDDGARMIS